MFGRAGPGRGAVDPRRARPGDRRALGPGSFAYRPGLGVGDAVREVARLRDEGFAWVLRTDVHDCFPSIPLDRLDRELPALIEDAELAAVVRLLLARGARRPGRCDLLAPKGLPQGSPLLANWMLEPIDERIRCGGFPVVRYGDDFCVVARSRDEAWRRRGWFTRRWRRPGWHWVLTRPR
ncbi:reverse transcriptase domain-containing protein [Amycolatopsis sp. NPDC051758]|uniref:reverse transcriptase domain-containing protein n=1 Tax=Amycolatopsis sp. NPDC051758 TaxID=3363935 RepID=UPI0037A0EA0E